MEKKDNSFSLVDTILQLHGLVIILLLAYFGKLLFIPLFFSFLIAVFLYPLCRWFEKHGLNRIASSILCIVILILTCSLVLYFVGSQFQHFVKDIPRLKTSLNTMVQNIQTWFKQHFNFDDDDETNYIDKTVGGLIGAIGVTVSSFFSLIVFFTLSVFFIFYMLFYRKVLNDFILSFFWPG